MKIKHKNGSWDIKTVTGMLAAVVVAFSVLPILASWGDIGIGKRIFLGNNISVGLTVFPLSKPGITVRFDPTPEKPRKCSIQIFWPAGIWQEDSPDSEKFASISIPDPAQPIEAASVRASKKYIISPWRDYASWDGTRFSFNPVSSIVTIAEIKFSKDGVLKLRSTGVAELILLVECEYILDKKLEASEVRFRLKDLQPQSDEDSPVPPQGAKKYL